MINPESFYRVYSNYLKDKYGEKVYKLPVNIACSCPNRDGTKGVGGCIFCGAKGSGNELLSQTLSVSEQLRRNRERIEKKYKAHRFIAYYQSFSNTYLDFERFKEYMREGAAFDGVLGLAISTRPDCVENRHLEYLCALRDEYDLEITLELGLQSSNDKTLEILNRGHSVKDYLEASERIKSFGLSLCTHLISDLPWDNRDDIKRAGELINTADSDFLKIHSLYIEKDTELERMYKNGLKLLESKDYIERTILLLETINPNVVIERLIGRVPEEDSYLSNWHRSWWIIRDQLLEEMKERKTYQGRRYLYKSS